MLLGRTSESIVFFESSHREQKAIKVDSAKIQHYFSHDAPAGRHSRQKLP